MSKVDKHHPNREWLDSSAADAINSQMLELYAESSDPFLEVKLTEFGCAVLYGDSSYQGKVTQNYVFSNYLVANASNGMLKGPLSNYSSAQ